MRVEINIFQDSGTLVFKETFDAFHHFTWDLPPGIEVWDSRSLLGFGGFTYGPKVIRYDHLRQEDE